jgi:hypothetical protein
MGRRPTEPVPVTGTLGDGLSLPNQSTLLEQALAQNPAVKVQEAEAERNGDVRHSPPRVSSPKLA